ncbi:hypothetical protein RchiOBHm_Chr2g0120791 [Rosa chinensis]|uniref:Uncharacterized protein n=1 Tax=Rosa chinensis TaxID=74649 RepID=A0A2P6RSD9_ROSCH|nr:hypothetical protein RchiOBHm_Chr2g0120791 [Rosa chinensis]
MHLEFRNISLHSSEFAFECANLVVLLHNILYIKRLACTYIQEHRLKGNAFGLVSFVS